MCVVCKCVCVLCVCVLCVCVFVCCVCMCVDNAGLFLTSLYMYLYVDVGVDY